jgi:hypothetical protein
VLLLLHRRFGNPGTLLRIAQVGHDSPESAQSSRTEVWDKSTAAFFVIVFLYHWVWFLAAVVLLVGGAVVVAVARLQLDFVYCCFCCTLPVCFFPEIQTGARKKIF